MAQKILFLDILTDNQEEKRRYEKEVFKGPYFELFRQAMKVDKKTLISIDATKEKFPSLGQFSHIIIGGSIHNPVVGEEKAWMKKVYSFIRKIIKKKIPLLGVCGGHQFIARALGEEVIYNPNGREFGTIDITLTKEGENDPLFLGVSKIFKAQLSHRCIVKKLKPHWRLLASSKLCQIQAVAINERTRIIQFHPELQARHLKALAKIRKAALLKEGFFKNEKEFLKFLSSIKETPKATKILRNFLTF